MNIETFTVTDTILEVSDIVQQRLMEHIVIDRYLSETIKQFVDSYGENSLNTIVSTILDNRLDIKTVFHKLIILADQETRTKRLQTKRKEEKYVMNIMKVQRELFKTSYENDIPIQTNFSLVINPDEEPTIQESNFITQIVPITDMLKLILEKLNPLYVVSLAATCKHLFQLVSQKYKLFPYVFEFYRYLETIGNGYEQDISICPIPQSELSVLNVLDYIISIVATDKKVKILVKNIQDCIFISLHLSRVSDKRILSMDDTYIKCYRDMSTAIIAEDDKYSIPEGDCDMFNNIISDYYDVIVGYESDNRPIAYKWFNQWNSNFSINLTRGSNRRFSANISTSLSTSFHRYFKHCLPIYFSYNNLHLRSEEDIEIDLLTKIYSNGYILVDELPDEETLTIAYENGLKYMTLSMVKHLFLYKGRINPKILVVQLSETSFVSDLLKSINLLKVKDIYVYKKGWYNIFKDCIKKGYKVF